MARWKFGVPANYGKLGQWWMQNYNTANNQQFLQKLSELGALDDGSQPVRSGSHHVQILPDIDSKICMVLRPDAIDPQLTYLNGILKELGIQAPNDTQRQILLGVYLITRCK